MATRRDIREAFYTELENAISGFDYIDGSDISQEMPERDEELPRIVHSDDYRQVPLNQGSNGPHKVNFDDEGNTAEVVFFSMMQAQFGVLVIHDDEEEKESIYEALRRHFERYEHSWWDESDIHEHVHEVDVQDSTSEDDEDREPIARGDRLLIRLGFKRDFRVVRDDLAGTDEYEDYDATYEDNIEEITHLIDADNDGTNDETYTTQ